VHLHGLLHSTFGRNIDLDSILDFRRRHLEMVSTLAQHLSGRVAGLSETSAQRFLTRLEAVVGGLAWASFPSPNVARALGNTDLAVFRLDFEEELTEILTGLLTRSSAR
jgi:hypothetical protein